MDHSINLFQKLSDRLRYIEFSLLYKGAITRADLVTKFNISDASATRAIKEYIDFSGQKNACFNSETKANEITSDFSPLYNIAEEEALYWLQLENAPQRNSALIENFPYINIPDNRSLAPIIQGIMHQKCVSIRYLSLSSESERTRIIVPHSLFNDGLKLYIRLFDRDRKCFLDFSPSRIISASLLDESPQIHEKIAYDTLWNDIVNLHLIPHPKFTKKQAEIIAYEYQMIRRQRIIPIRKALINYFLRAWYVDCSKDAILDPNHYHLWLENRDIIQSHLHPMAHGSQL